MKFSNVPSTSVKLMLFPFSLEGAARIWLEKEPPRLILTWDDLVSKFINKFFPPSKTINLRNEITRFQQRFNENFYDGMGPDSNSDERILDKKNQKPQAPARVKAGSGKVVGYLWIPFEYPTISDRRDVYLKEESSNSRGRTCSRRLCCRSPSPLIIGRSFIKISDVLDCMYECGINFLWSQKEAITFNLDQTSRYSSNYDDMTANRIDFIEMACEEYSQEVLGFSDVIANGNPTPYYDPIVSTSSPTLTPFGDSDFLLEEVDAFLALEDDPTLLEVDDSYYDPEGDILLLKSFLNDDPSLPPPTQGNNMLEIQKELKSLVSPVHCVPKKGGFTIVENDENELIPNRLATEKLNEATRKDHFPLPFMDQMLERLAGNEYYCFLNGFSGYFQIPIDPNDQEKTTFTCPYGTFAYRGMPFGLCNAPGTFQRCMMAIFHDMIEKTIEVFMDDFSVFRNSFENCLSHVDKMLQRCEDINLCLNWEKSHFIVKECIVLGYKISKKGIEVDKAKIDVIAKLPHPTTVKGVRSFLGHVGFY
ncbi:reverse transcriptase domain-containing protein [Tanacetum coccineum]